MKYIKLDENLIPPSKIVCIGRNYLDHIIELKNEVPKDMVFFLKPNSSITNKLIFPKSSRSCQYEAEISFLIERRKICGVGFGLDLTLRDVQSTLKARGLPWERAKAFDNSAVFSKFVPFEYNNQNLEIRLFINNNLVQNSDINHMINKPNDIIKEVSTFMSFEDGDILMTGTPKGVGEIKLGDIFRGEILLDGKKIISQEFEVVL